MSHENYALVQDLDTTKSACTAKSHEHNIHVSKTTLVNTQIE